MWVSSPVWRKDAARSSRPGGRSIRLGAPRSARRRGPGKAPGGDPGHSLFVPSTAHVFRRDSARLPRQGSDDLRSIVAASAGAVGAGAARPGIRRGRPGEARRSPRLRDRRVHARGATPPRAGGRAFSAGGAGAGRAPRRFTGRGDAVFRYRRRGARGGAGRGEVRPGRGEDLEARVVAAALRASEAHARLPALAPGLLGAGEGSLPPRRRKSPPSPDGRTDRRTPSRSGPKPGIPMGTSSGLARRASRPRGRGGAAKARALAAIRSLGRARRRGRTRRPPRRRHASQEQP